MAFFVSPAVTQPVPGAQFPRMPISQAGEPRSGISSEHHHIIIIETAAARGMSGMVMVPVGLHAAFLVCQAHEEPGRAHLCGDCPRCWGHSRRQKGVLPLRSSDSTEGARERRQGLRRKRTESDGAGRGEETGTTRVRLNEEFVALEQSPPASEKAILGRNIMERSSEGKGRGQDMHLCPRCRGSIGFSGPPWARGTTVPAARRGTGI